MTPNYDIKYLKRTMRRYLRKGEDGMFHYTHHFKAQSSTDKSLRIWDQGHT